MSKLIKREGENLEILEVEEILRQRGYSRTYETVPENLQPMEYIKRLYVNGYDHLPGEEIYQLLWIELTS